MPTKFKNKMAKLPPIIQSNISKKDIEKLRELRKYNLVDELIKNKIVKNSRIKHWWEIEKMKYELYIGSSSSKKIY